MDSTSVAEIPDKHAAIVAALAGLDEGKGLRAIAATLGMHFSRLHRWLLSEVPEQYRAAQAEALAARIVEADQELDDARDHVSISRSREKCRFARFDAERRLARLWGPKQEVAASIAVQHLDDRELARRYAFLEQNATRHGTVIEIEPEALTDQELSAVDSQKGFTNSRLRHSCTSGT
jgi:hypothetical protein